jgi:hypothetical protein
MSCGPRSPCLVLFGFLKAGWLAREKELEMGCHWIFIANSAMLTFVNVDPHLLSACVER